MRLRRCDARYDTYMFRRVLFWVILLAAGWLATTHGSAVSQIVKTARYGSWQWLVAAVALQVAYYALRLLMFREAFGAAGIKRSMRELAPVMFSALYLNTVAPGAGVSSSSLLAQDAMRRGHDPNRSLQMPVIAQLAQFSGFAVVMFAGFWYLVSLDTIHLYEVASGVIVLGTIVAMAIGLALSVLRPRTMTGVLGRLEGALMWFAGILHRPAAKGWAARATGRYADTGRTIAENPRGLFATWAVATAAYAVDLFSFVAVGFSLGWPALGALIAAFAVGMLVWMVSVIPQGIGVVEIVIALMLASFGADAPTAILIALVFRILTYWIPLGIGALVVDRVETLAGLRREAAEVFPVRLAATFTFFVGVMNIVSAATPAVAQRLELLESVLPLQSEYGRLSAAIAGVALMLLARGLWRRKRLVWLIAVVVLAISVVSHLLKGLDYEEAAISTALLIFLLVKRREFRARSDAPSIAQGIRVLVAAFVITLAYGTAGFFLLERQFNIGEFTFWPAVRQTVVMFTQFYDPGVHPITRFGSYFIASIYVVAMFSIGFALVMLLRPVLVRSRATPAERRRAQVIVDRYGRTPLAEMALLPDKTYFFTGNSVIAYRLVGDVALALGDPIGPPEEARSVIHAFSDQAADNDWRPAFYQTLPDFLDAYEAEGFSAARIGHEAIVDAQAFTLSGRRYRVERNLMNRLGNEGYTAVYHPAPQSAAMLAALRDVSDAWLAASGGSEMGFSLGWFDDEYVHGSNVMTVEGPDGEIEAFVNVLVEQASREVTIDLMRYRPSAPDGVMDFTFIRLAEWARENGFSTFNLGFSALSGVGEQEDPAVERVLRLVYEHGNRFYSFKGLYSFKNKFGPEWQPRYLIYPDAAALPAVLAAIVRANTGAADLPERTAQGPGAPVPA